MRNHHTHEELVLANLNQSRHRTEQELTMAMTETLKRPGDLEDQKLTKRGCQGFLQMKKKDRESI